MRTMGATGCRLVSAGHKGVADALPRSWRNCSHGVARVTIEFGANTTNTAVRAHFRDYARRGSSVTWAPVTIIIDSGQTGTPAPTTAEYTESTNWSGYVVPSMQTVIDATSGTWTVPTLNCTDTPNASVSEWVGIGGVNWPGGGNSGALLQTGTEDRCVGAAQQDDAWWELYPSNPNASITFANLDVSPGDEVVASVHKTAGGHWTTKIDDVTKGIAGVMVTGAEWGTAGDHSGSSAFSKGGSSAQYAYEGGYSAEWIVEDSGTTPTQLTPFANFGAVTFSDLATSLRTWTLTPAEGVELVQKGVTLSTPGAPTSDSFDVRYTGP